MKNLRKIFLPIAFVAGLSISASAQNDKKPPPKETPPVIVAKPKPSPKDEKPKGDKKPQAIIFNQKYVLAFH